MKKLLAIALLFSTLGLAGCFESGGLVGKWESDKIMGMQNKYEFKTNSMVVSVMGSEQEFMIDGYVSEKGRLGVVMHGDSKITVWFDSVNNDTIRPSGFGSDHLNYHRVK